MESEKNNTHIHFTTASVWPAARRYRTTRRPRDGQHKKKKRVDRHEAGSERAGSYAASKRMKKKNKQRKRPSKHGANNTNWKLKKIFRLELFIIVIIINITIYCCGWTMYISHDLAVWPDSFILSSAHYSRDLCTRACVCVLFVSTDHFICYHFYLLYIFMEKSRKLRCYSLYIYISLLYAVFVCSMLLLRLQFLSSWILATQWANPISNIYVLQAQ